MAEAARHMKANKRVAGQACGWCAEPLALGEDVAVCQSCEAAHHAKCWDGSGGCARDGCVNAPLKRLEPAPAPQPLPGNPYGAYAAAPPVAPQVIPGFIYCPRCRSVLPDGAPVCNVCGFVTSADGMYHGPKQNAPGAVAALVLGILSFFICGLILGPIAIVKANEAKTAIRSNPMYGGGGMATAGFVLGIIALVLNVIVIIVRVGSL